MMWYGVSCARPCALLRGPAFLMPLYHSLKILSPPKMWLKGRFFFYKSPHERLAAYTISSEVRSLFRKEKHHNTRPEFWTPIFIYRIDSLSWKLGRRRDLPCGVPMVWLPACMAKRIALASGCRDHEITHCGGDQTMQMYGRFGRFPQFLWCIVWVASIMAPEKWAVPRILLRVYLYRCNYHWFI